MATSRELYEQQRKMIEAKEEFNTNVNAFLSTCDSAISSVKSIVQECLACNDTNIKSNAASGGGIKKAEDSITKLQEKVASELAAANSSIQAEIDELGRKAAEAAAREEALIMAKNRQRVKQNTLSGSNKTYRESNISYIAKE